MNWLLIYEFFCEYRMNECKNDFLIKLDKKLS